MNVADNPDDFCPRSVVLTCPQLNPFAEWILAREELSSGHFPDDCHLVVSGGVRLREQAAAEERDLHGGEIVRTHDVTVDRRNLRIGDAAILDDESALIETSETSRNRWCAGYAHRLDPGDLLDAAEHFCLGANDGLVIFIFRAAQREIYPVEILNIEAGIDPPHEYEALQQEAGGNALDEGVADL